MSDGNRSSIVKERWGFLAECLRSASRPSEHRLPTHSPTQSTPVFRSSIRRFESFGLFDRETSPINDTDLETRKEIKDEDDEEDSDDWDFEYVAYAVGCSSIDNNIRVDLRLYRQLPSLQELQSFNNTGNVCVWPSEECLAWYLLENTSTNTFSSVRNVCELGSGMTALAGLICALFWPSLDYVLLTDGNKRSVANLTSVVHLNSDRYVARCVETGILRWGSSVAEISKRNSPNSYLRQFAGRFDLIICADCLFFEDSHLDLINTIDLLMEETHGRCLCVAPERAGSFERFRRLAVQRFPYVCYSERYSPRVSARHKELLAVSDTGYSSDLHYPKMLMIGRCAEDVPLPISECM